MAPPLPPTSITLTIKVPPGYIEGGLDQFALGSVAVSSTIGAIRQQIQQVVPSHPAPEKQRILYGGRALVDNEQTLADALNTKRDPTQTEYVVHLLVKGEGQGSSTPAASSAHRRGASTPVAGPAPPPAQGQLPEQLRQQQEQINRLLLQQPQMQQQRNQMGSMMPPQFAGMPQMPMPPGFPFQQGPVMGQGFGQAVQQGQQQRAAMGMHGVGQQGQQGQQIQTGQPQNGTATNGESQTAAAPGAQPPHLDPQQYTHWGRLASPPPPAAANGQVGQQQQPQQGVPRPISGQGFHFEGIGPNGQRVQIHQQTLQIPGMPGQQPFGMFPGQQAFGMPGGQPFGMPGMMPQIQGFGGQPQGMLGQPPQQQQPAGPSALDRARENVAEMRRMLDEMRDSTVATEDQRTRLERLRERVQNVDDYIDPLHLGGATNSPAPAGRRSAPPQAGAPAPGAAQPPAQAPGQYNHWARLPSANAFAMPPMPPGAAMFNAPRGPVFGNPLLHQPRQPSGTDTTCYLLSGPQGPQALLFSPQHGTYTGAFTHTSAAARPTPTPTTQPAAQSPQEIAQQALAQLVQPAQQPPNPAAAVPAPPAAAAGQPNAQAQAQAAAADPNAPAQALLNHVWLLFRILIFAYFVLGSNLGWKRPLALMAIGVGFWMVRNGLFGEGGVLRRWWEGVVHVGPPGQAAGGEAGGAQGVGGAEGARQQAMPTPEQVARRLMEERDVGRRQAWREVVRPVERAVALFVASLWPGIGEAHVRARREEEERRRNEEEVARRRAEEDETKRREEADEEAREGGDGTAEKGGAVVAGEGAAEGGSSAVAESEKKASEGVETQSGSVGGA